MIDFSHLHRKIFDTGMGERTRTLLSGFNWIVSAAILSRVLCGLATALAARYIGPSMFGQANVALAATFWIQVPLFLGLPTAMLHYIPQADGGLKERWISNGYRLLGLSSMVTLLLVYLLRDPLSRWQHMTSAQISWALVWSFGFLMYIAGTTYCNALEQFRKRAVLDVLFAIIFPTAAALAWHLHSLNGATYIYALAIGYGLAGMFGVFPALRSASRGPLDIHQGRRLLSYGLIASLGSISSALFNSPARLVTNRYMAASDVGVLSAYQSGSIQMALFFLAAAAQVFFPIASRTPDRKALFLKIHRLMLWSFPGLFLAFGFITVLYFLVLGSRYPLRELTLVLFALAAVLSFDHGLLSWYFASAGRRGVLTSSLIGVIAGAMNLGACRLFIPHLGINGAGIACIMGAGVGLLACYGLFYYSDRGQPPSI